EDPALLSGESGENRLSSIISVHKRKDRGALPDERHLTLLDFFEKPAISGETRPGTIEMPEPQHCTASGFRDRFQSFHPGKDGIERFWGRGPERCFLIS